MTKSAYFLLKAPASKLVDTIVSLAAKQRQLEAELDTAKARLRALVIPEFFEVANGSSKPPQGVEVPWQEGARLRVCVPRYLHSVDLKAMPSFAAECFREHHKLGGMIKTPENGNFARLKADVGAVLSGHGEAHWASRLLPVDDFHTKRHELFSPEQNLAIDQAAPLQIRVLV